MSEENVTNEPVADDVAQESQAAPESISLQELGLLAQIVDLASQRGAFRGNEMTQVGAVYDKLTSFLNKVEEAQQAAAEAAEGEQVPVEDDESGEANG